METVTAPSIPIPDYPTGYPSPKRRVGQAWTAAWTELLKAGSEYTDGVQLAEKTAKKVHLAPSTMITLFTRAATAGVLERKHQPAATTRGIRQRTFYRVPQQP
jgi:hypothetical protein